MTIIAPIIIILIIAVLGITVFLAHDCLVVIEGNTRLYENVYNIEIYNRKRSEISEITIDKNGMYSIFEIDKSFEIENPIYFKNKTYFFKVNSSYKKYNPRVFLFGKKALEEVLNLNEEK